MPGNYVDKVQNRHNLEHILDGNYHNYIAIKNICEEIYYLYLVAIPKLNVWNHDDIYLTPILIGHQHIQNEPAKTINIDDVYLMRKQFSKQVT